METALFIARIIGPCYLVMAAGMLRNKKFYQKFMDDFSANTVLVFFSGLLALVFGLLVVLAHDARGTAGWTIIITLFGWGGIIKGVWLIVFPETAAGFMRFYQKNKSLLTVHAAAAFVLGVVLTFFGWFAG